MQYESVCTREHFCKDEWMNKQTKLQNQNKHESIVGQVRPYNTLKIE